jgi:hypothetical protein
MNAPMFRAFVEQSPAQSLSVAGIMDNLPVIKSLISGEN